MFNLGGSLTGAWSRGNYNSGTGTVVEADDENSIDTSEHQHHRRDSSLDEASMSDLTSTSYQTSDAVPTTIVNSHSQDLDDGSSSHQPLSYNNSSTLLVRRPARITHQSRLESIPSVGYTNSHDMSDDSRSNNDHHEQSQPHCEQQPRNGGRHNDGGQQQFDDGRRRCAVPSADNDRDPYGPNHHHPLHYQDDDDEDEDDGNNKNKFTSYNEKERGMTRQSAADDTDETTTVESEMEWTAADSSPNSSSTSFVRSSGRFSSKSTDGDVDTDDDGDDNSLSNDMEQHHHLHSSSSGTSEGGGRPTNLGWRGRSTSAPATSSPLSSPTRSSPTGSISQPRYAVEFRHRHPHPPQQHQYQQAPGEPTVTTTPTTPNTPTAVYDRDGRHVECVALDVDDPYLSGSSSASGGEDYDLEHGARWVGAAAAPGVGRYDHSVYPHHHHTAATLPYRPSRHVAPYGAAAAAAAAAAAYHHQHQQPVPSHLYRKSDPAGTCGGLVRTARTILILGALGAASVLLRAHFLIAGGFAAGSVGHGVLKGGVGGVGGVGSSGGGIAAVKLASGALALPRVMTKHLLLSEATREAVLAEREVLKERVQRMTRTLPDGTPIMTRTLPDGTPITSPQSGSKSTESNRRLAVEDRVSVGETYAVRVTPTPGRGDLTDAAVERLAQCTSIADVRVAAPTEAYGEGTSAAVSSVLGGWGDEGSVVKRPGLTTDAVLLLADDLAFTCEELDRAFEVWSNDPDRMVGFYTYDLLPSKTGKQLTYALGEVPRGTGSYSVVSDRAAFVHRSYLTSISAKAASDAVAEWQQGPSAASGDEQSQIDHKCSSLSLSLAVTAVSSKAPIAVASDPLELRGPSKSSSSDDLSASAAECLLGMTSALDLQVLPSEERVYIGSS